MNKNHNYNASSYQISSEKNPNYYDNTGGSASRFFYCAKASKSERGEGNTHPTVKPLRLMEYLIRLITPPEGTVFDPFAGSGTTGLACMNENKSFIGCEIEKESYDIAMKRIENHKAQLKLDLC